MAHTRKTEDVLNNTPAEDTDYDETTRDYILSESRNEDAPLPEPARAHVEEVDGEDYIVRDPARESFEEEEGAPAEDEELEDDEPRSMLEELELAPAEGLISERQSPVAEAMRPEEETLTAEEMVQDDWIDEQDMLDMAQIKDVLDPVESE